MTESKFLLLLEFRHFILIFCEIHAWVFIAADYIIVYCNRSVHSYCHINVCTPGGQISKLLMHATQMGSALKFSFWALSIPSQVFCNHTWWVCQILRLHQERTSLVENIVNLCQSPLCISAWPNQGQVSRKGLVVGIWYFSKTCACLRLTKPKDPCGEGIRGKTTLLLCIGICLHTKGSLKQHLIGKILREII